MSRGLETLPKQVRSQRVQLHMLDLKEPKTVIYLSPGKITASCVAYTSDARCIKERQ
jgi:hypothetical protein